MWRSVVRLCAGALLAAAVLAQQKPVDPALIVGDLERQSTALVQAWLHHPDPRYQAWGTYRALRDRRPLVGAAGLPRRAPARARVPSACDPPASAALK